jgi:hypothetical protein
MIVVKKVLIPSISATPAQTLPPVDLHRAVALPVENGESVMLRASNALSDGRPRHHICGRMRLPNPAGERLPSPREGSTALPPGTHAR